MATALDDIVQFVQRVSHPARKVHTASAKRRWFNLEALLDACVTVATDERPGIWLVVSTIPVRAIRTSSGNFAPRSWIRKPTSEQRWPRSRRTIFNAIGTLPKRTCAIRRRTAGRLGPITIPFECGAGVGHRRCVTVAAPTYRDNRANVLDPVYIATVRHGAAARSGVDV